MSKAMSIDYGLRRCGIAVSDDLRRIAFARITLDNDRWFLTELLKIINEESVSTIVIGYPLGLKGNKTSQTLEVEKFCGELREFLSSRKKNIEIVTYDERLTSRIAKASMLESGMRKKKRQDKSQLDLISATIILQNYLDSVNNLKGE
ncbi:MAG: Holliday junction resolvase RuvX [Ignavibacteria bacterium]|nr:Holliday junction resolvase RuvX [Ignavibacteria bacterium]